MTADKSSSSLPRIPKLGKKENIRPGWLPSVVHVGKKMSEVSAPRAQSVKDCLEVKDFQSYLVLDVWECNMEALQKASVSLAASS
ncbi:hypothetical protein J4Q44_G00144080 [Coregonus suidteri]|uniref:Uncharacterized protein n=1 Tax=Coregonus suidteri TaxID=861788 RepID=A0AAN8LR55_9TELE